MTLDKVEPAKKFGGPLRLTTLGRKMFLGLGNAETWIEDIVKEINDKDVGDADWEIHKFAKNYIYNDFKPTKEQSDKMGEVAYNFGLDRNNVKDVLFISLRDVLLEAREFEVPSPSRF